MPGWLISDPKWLITTGIAVVALAISSYVASTRYLERRLKIRVSFRQNPPRRPFVATAGVYFKNVGAKAFISNCFLEVKGVDRKFDILRRDSDVSFPFPLEPYEPRDFTQRLDRLHKEFIDAGQFGTIRVRGVVVERSGKRFNSPWIPLDLTQTPTS